jgi:hypothetical protein
MQRKLSIKLPTSLQDPRINGEESMEKLANG